MSFTSDLIAWYEENKRDLPFRGIRDPYLIWVSEVILQQTRMEQGLDYYCRFIERYHDIRSLASASEEEVLKTWQGMGYYSRARNMHESARQIVTSMGGLFPETFEQILKLKGVGDYSAASIASLAFGECRAAIDGNVYRFMARHFGIREETGSSAGKRKIKEMAETLMDNDQPGTFNQAMIEFGAMVCTPQNPSCLSCVFQSSCYAWFHQLVKEIPAKKRTAKTRNRYLHYLVMTFNSSNGPGVILNKREGTDIWKNLYDFPVIEKTEKLSLNKLMNTLEWKAIFDGKKPGDITFSEEFKHILSHQVIHATFFHISLNEPPLQFENRIVIEEMNTLPIPKLISKYWEKYFI
ncbi:MAG: A/G-specific adenine glycosylase [Bacteroidales bacterium]|nr:A/G-specific adenine glycosylase [Bacteroidales bacterium]